jgi:hypothetical protein
MDRLSPSDSSPSLSDVDEPMFEGESPVYEEQPLSPPPDIRGLPSTGSNKRRAPGGPMASQPNIKSRSRRGDEQRAYNAEGGPPGMRRGPGPEGRREELVDVELAKYLRKGMFFTLLF